MKKLLLLTLLIVFVQSCATQEFIHNPNEVENPLLKLEIDESLKYIVKGKVISEESHQTSGLYSNDNFIVYGQKTTNSYISKGVIIKYRSLKSKNSKWSPSIFKPGNFALEQGVEKVKNINFKYSIFATPVSIAGRVTKAIADSGYIVPDLILVKNSKEIFDDKAEVLLDIYYFEDISEYNYGYSWRGPELLGKSEKTFLSNFKKNASNAIRFTEK